MLDIPYPPLEVEEKNLRYARLLHKDYVGRNGELTAITQYLYQYFLTTVNKPDIAKTLKCIEIIEMEHFRMIGTLIVLLGGDPIYMAPQSRKPTYWCTSNVDTEKEIIKFLSDNIRIEEIAIYNYEQRVEQIKDEKVRAVIERIILDEEHHIMLFNSLLTEFINKNT